jgi:hypothetical protein
MNDLYLPVREDCHFAGTLSTKIFPLGKTHLGGAGFTKTVDFTEAQKPLI